MLFTGTVEQISSRDNSPDIAFNNTKTKLYYWLEGNNKDSFWNKLLKKIKFDIISIEIVKSNKVYTITGDNDWATTIKVTLKPIAESSYDKLIAKYGEQEVIDKIIFMLEEAKKL